MAGQLLIRLGLLTGTLLLGTKVSVAAQNVLPGDHFLITEDSVRLYYRIVGSGETTVVIPFASLHGTAFDDLAEGRRLVLYDPRNRGRSDAAPLNRVSLEYQIKDVEAVRRKVGAERVALIGWSGMGMELYAYTKRHPEHVTRLVQLAPVPPRLQPYSEAMGRDRRSRTNADAWRAFQASDQQGAFRDRPAERCRALSRVTRVALFADTSKAAMTPDVCDSPNEWADRQGPYFEALLGSFGDFDWRPSLAWVTVPRLVIHGARDNIPLDGNLEWVSGRPTARLMVVKDAGHWPHYERPGVTLPAIDTFLSGRWPESSKAVP